MAKLTGQTIADSYDQLLIVGDANGISSSLQAVESADTGGSSSALSISTVAISVAGNATITTADNTDTLTLTSTDADANAAPNLRLYRNSASPADSDLFGQIDFEGRNDNSQDFIGAQISTATGDVSDGTEDAEIRFDVMTAGTLREYLRLASGSTPSVIINQDSQDIDFQVQSDNSTHALFVQGSDGSVGIGVSTPSGGLQIATGYGGSTGSLRVDGTNNNSHFNVNANEDTYIRSGTSSGNVILQDTGGNVNIGSSTFYGTDGTTFEVNSVAPGTGVYGGVSIHTWESGGASTGPQLTLARSKSQTAGNYAIVADNDRLGQIFFKGADGNSWCYGASITAFVDGSPGDGDMPTRLVFGTVADGAGTPTDRMTIDSSGNVGIGDATPNARLDVEGDSADYLVKMANDGNNANRYGIYIMAGADDASGTTYYLNCADGNGDEVGYIANTSGTFALTDPSDSRLKKNIVDTSVKGLEAVSMMKVRDFEWKKSGDKCIGGFIAQELKEAYAPAVSGEGGEMQEYEVSPAIKAIPAKDAVTQQKTVDEEVEEEVTTTEVVLEDGKYVQKTTTETVTKTVKVPQYDEEDLYDEDGEVIGKHQIPIMETVEEAVEAIEAVEAVMGEKIKPMGVARDVLVPVLVKAIQELSAKVEALENA